MCKEMVMRKLFFCLWMVCATVTFASDWHRERVRAYRQGCDAALDREDLLATASLIALVVEAAAEAAKNMTGVITQHIIPNTEESTEKMLKLNAFDKK
jgi:uncharacterized protein Yka (UPF0111/DUF47 family)